jgi:hypothetical protein
MTFRDERRQRFLDETHYKEFDEELADRIQDFAKEIWKENLLPSARRSFAWRVASDNLQLLLLRYTAGRSLVELRDQLPTAIAAFDTYIPLDISRPNEAHTLEITQLEAYVYVMWLLALCRLLGHERLIPKVIAWLDRNAEFNRGRDTIFERVVEKLTGNMQDPGRYSLHVAAYRPLGRAVLAEDAADRPALVKEFVENWYKHMKECYWAGTHTDREGSSYFGYWCLEAALVTFLWDIDDTSYRDHLVYPKDLVAYARENFPLRDPSAPSADARLRCPAGQPCPKAGYWFTPAKADSRRLFKAGEIMPSVGGDYGDTIWQWDERQ